MTPPHWHRQVQLALREGWRLISTVGEPGTHGAVVTGMHGWGGRGPMAAAVAAATCGLVGVVHMPKGAMLAIGLLSWMVAASAPPACTGAPCGITVSVLGAKPNEHVNAAPAVTWIVTGRVWSLADGAARGGRPLVGATDIAREGKRRPVRAPGGTVQRKPTAGVSNVVGAGHRSGDEL